ncbi:hypothetical protein M501DRAFT_1012800 [Patellaria atrata CBS 101060]|uniref:Uncharacterized protein n=1 Tax=Patellaria atrata CBS 101060 TaxID=1346257 RepID=A0A9P4VVV5_9PEZI|nr:hypothetical protein M501DRAFT_1012800 [Patellaria atrata CBS 101060]
MTSPDSGQLVSQNWTPWLVMAPRLIQTLGVCIAAASTPRVCQIRLAGSDVKYRDLATNLVDIPNQGQNAFLDAYSDLLDIGMQTNSMGRPGGIFDQLSEIKSDEEGERTAVQFKDWKKDVDKVHRALNATQSETSAKYLEAEEELKAINKELTLQQAVMTSVQGDLNLAKDEQDHATGTMMSFDLGWATLGALVATGSSAYRLSIATEQVAQAERVLGQKRSTAMEMDFNPTKVNLDLQGTEAK